MTAKAEALAVGPTCIDPSQAARARGDVASAMEASAVDGALLRGTHAPRARTHARPHTHAPVAASRGLLYPVLQCNPALHGPEIARDRGDAHRGSVARAETLSWWWVVVGLAENVAALEREADRFERNCEQLQQYYQSLLTVTAVWVRFARGSIARESKSASGRRKRKRT